MASYSTVVTLPSGKKVRGIIENGKTRLKDGSRPPAGSLVETRGGTFKVGTSGSQKVDNKKSTNVKEISGGRNSSGKSSGKSGGSSRSIAVRDYFKDYNYNVDYDPNTKNIRVYDPNTGHSAMITTGFYDNPSGKAYISPDMATRVLNTIASGKYTYKPGGQQQTALQSIAGAIVKQPVEQPLQQQGIAPKFNFPEYQKINYPYLSLNEALAKAQKLYNPAYQLQLLRANETFSQDYRNLPYYLNAKGQAFGGLREAGEKGLSQEHAKALATAGFQYQQLLNQAAQQLYEQSKEEALQAEQQDYTRYLNARDRAYQMYRDYVGDQKYLSEREYQKLRDAINDLWKQREYERQLSLDEFNKKMKEKGFDLDQSNLNLAWAQYNLAKDKFNYQKDLDALNDRTGSNIDYADIAQAAIRLAQNDPRVIEQGGSMTAEEFNKIVQEYLEQIFDTIAKGSFYTDRGSLFSDTYPR